MPTGQFRWESDLGVGTEALFTGARGAPGRVRKQDVSRVRLVGIASAPRRAGQAGCECRHRVPAEWAWSPLVPGLGDGIGQTYAMIISSGACTKSGCTPNCAPSAFFVPCEAHRVELP